MQPLSGFLSSTMLVPMWALGDIEIRLEINSGAEALMDIENGSPGLALTDPKFTISAFKYRIELMFTFL